MKFHAGTLSNRLEICFDASDTWLLSCFPDSSSGCSSTSNAFIFSLHNKEGLGPFKSMVAKPACAIFCHSSHGPSFGQGHDIYINSSGGSATYSHAGNKYDDYSFPSGIKDQSTVLGGSNSFTPDDVEVFHISWVIFRWSESVPGCGTSRWNAWITLVDVE